MRRLTALAALVAAGVAGCTQGSGRTGDAGGLGSEPRSERSVARFEPDDWITFGDFRYVATVAASQTTAYFGSTAGVERLDTLRDRWLSPVTAADGLPDDRVTALAVDPVGEDLWIGTRRGLAHLAFDGTVERAWGPPPSAVLELAIDPRDGSVYAFVAGGWWRGRGGSPVFERSDPPPSGASGAVDARDLDPTSVPWMDPLYVRSPAHPSEVFRLTRVVRDLRGDFYVGTWGDNGRRWGRARADWEALYFGLAGASGGPLARTSDGTWFAAGPGPARGDGTAPAAMAMADSTGHWSYVLPGITPGLPTAVAHCLLAVGDTLYMGSDHGLTQRVGDTWTTWGWSAEPSLGAVTGLAIDRDRLWVGTTSGLVAFDPATGRGEVVHLRGRAVTALHAMRDTVFVGTEAGLWKGVRRAGATPADSFGRLPSLSGDVRALARLGDLLAVGTGTGLEIWPLGGGEPQRILAGGRLTEPPLSLAADGEQLWIGTRTGLLRYRPVSGEWERYGPEDGLAEGPVLHLLAEPGAIWASTPTGVTRFGWRDAGR
ncbi:MAG: two-component regulator propeller domain-containing protein [Gemmatimonadota bacterium]